jgi:hypothetical protein
LRRAASATEFRGTLGSGLPLLCLFYHCVVYHFFIPRLLLVLLLVWRLFLLLDSELMWHALRLQVTMSDDITLNEWHVDGTLLQWFGV